MKKKVKFLFTDLNYLNNNYGAQGIAFPIMDKLKEHFDAKYTFVIPEINYRDNFLFAQQNKFSIISNPKSGFILERGGIFLFLYKIIRFLKRKNTIGKDEKNKYSTLIKTFGKNDVVIDLAGIELIGNQRFKGKWLNYMKTVYMQRLARKCGRPYLKYTKSYGPFRGIIYKFFIKKQLSRLPFVFVRGKENLEEFKKLKLKIPIHSFPDISISLKPESKDWAIKYIRNLGLDPLKPIGGISPSSVIAKIFSNNGNSSCGSSHIKLCKKIIEFYQSRGQQILLIPHSIDKKNPKECDLFLSEKIYSDLENKNGVFIISDILNYRQVRSIIGLLDFYITGRYHSVSSALSMGIPVISLSWHIKYKDIMSLFLDNYLVVDCRVTNIDRALSLIKKYYDHRQWFDKKEVLRNKEKVIKKIEKSIYIMLDNIKK